MTDPNIDIFDRERVFIETILSPLLIKLPHLKVVMEHITTMDAVKFIESCNEGRLQNELFFSSSFFSCFYNSVRMSLCTMVWLYFYASWVSRVQTNKTILYLEEDCMDPLYPAHCWNLVHWASFYLYYIFSYIFVIRFCCCHCHATAPSSEQKFLISRWTTASQLLPSSTKTRDS